ncbi:MAG: NAD(P)/FAD-dependent oxidoreductase [Burkholderiaceae bacterium]
MKRIAVIGAGITGLGAAHRLAKQHHVTLFEAGATLGGHANTVDVTLEGATHGVDTGFLVFNERTYPNLIKLFDELAVPTAKSGMSFSVQVKSRGLEWCGSDLNAVFAQRRNLLSPRFLRMVSQILRFNRESTALVQAGTVPDCSLGDYLARGGYSQELTDWYLLPMAACVWSCPSATMMQYPARTFLQFCHNHGLLQGFDGRPQWMTVRGGSREYVKRIAASLQDVRVATPVLSVQHSAGIAPSVQTGEGTQAFDAVVLACHSDQALRLLARPSTAQTDVLQHLRYESNRAVLHTDATVLPKTQRAWAAWNYESRQASSTQDSAVCCHYLINRLQPLPFKQPVIVSLNPISMPQQVIAQFEYEHPIFDAAAVAAQSRLPAIQGSDGLWFAGAWAGYGFHEDGLKSGLAAADGVLHAMAASSRAVAA